jgi:hypothetical protein
MSWTAIVLNEEGSFSHSFSFIGSHNKETAFEFAQSLTPLLVLAIVAGEHPVYSPDIS